MAKKEIATFLGPQLGLSTLGEHAYGMSGSVTDGGSDTAATTLLDFQSGKQYIIGTIDFTNNVASAHNIYFTISFNGLLVNETKEATAALIPLKYDILIPPLTEVVVKWGAGTTGEGSVMLVGRVYV